MARKVLTVLWVIGGAALVPVLVAHRHDLAAAAALLVTVCPAWLSVAALAEAVSYLTRGGALRAVLRGGLGTGVLAAITIAGDAVAYVLPFGFTAGGAVAVGEIRRFGVPRATAWWGLGIATLVSAAALGVVAAAGIVLATGTGLLAVGAAVAVAVGLWRWGLRGRWTSLALRSLMAAAVGMLLSWLADLAVLAVAFVALGERPPWAGLVLAYCLGQAASALPFTPGGLGVAEGGLTAALVAFGGPAGTLTAVLLYRLISHWVVVPAGGLAWLLLRRRSTDEFRAGPWSVLVEGDERCPPRT